MNLKDYLDQVKDMDLEEFLELGEEDQDQITKEFIAYINNEELEIEIDIEALI